MKIRIHNTQTGNELVHHLESGGVVEGYDDFQVPLGEVVVSVQWFEDEIFVQTWQLVDYLRMVRIKVEALHDTVESKQFKEMAKGIPVMPQAQVTVPVPDDEIPF